jgi:hypothetical protein
MVIDSCCQYEVIVKKWMQTERVAFELSAFLYFSRQSTLKLTFKVNAFCGHLFINSSPYEGAQTKKEVQIRPFLCELPVILYLTRWMA